MRYITGLYSRRRCTIGFSAIADCPAKHKAKVGHNSEIFHNNELIESSADCPSLYASSAQCSGTASEFRRGAAEVMVCMLLTQWSGPTVIFYSQTER